MVLGSDVDSGANVPTLAPDNQTARPSEKASNDGESDSTNLDIVEPQKVDGMEVLWKCWHCLNPFGPYVCGQCNKAVYLWCIVKGVAFAYPLWCVLFMVGGER